MKFSKDSNIEEVNSFIKEQIQKHIKMASSENDLFYQALEEVILSVAPFYLSDAKYARNSIVKRIATPDRVIKFKVEWLGDHLKRIYSNI